MNGYHVIVYGLAGVLSLTLLLGLLRLVWMSSTGSEKVFNYRIVPHPDKADCFIIEVQILEGAFGFSKSWERYSHQVGWFSYPVSFKTRGEAERELQKIKAKNS